MNYAEGLLANPAFGKKPERRRTPGGPEAVPRKQLEQHGLAPLLVTGQVRCSVGLPFLTVQISTTLITCVAQDNLANPAFGRKHRELAYVPSSAGCPNHAPHTVHLPTHLT